MLRGDISFAWRPRGAMTANVGQLRNRSQIASYAVLLDGSIDVPQWRAGRVTPYVTGGAGITRNTYHDEGTGPPGGPVVLLTGDNTNTYFAWRAGGGVTIDLARAWALDVGWRYADYAKVATGTGFESRVPGIELIDHLPQAPTWTLATSEVRVAVRKTFGSARTGAPLGAQAPANRGAYLRFDGGGTMGLDPELVIDQLNFPLIVDFNPGFHAAVGAGYRLNAHWRGDVTIAVLSALRQYSYQRAEPIGAADISSVGVMVSAYYDLARMGAVTPYVGAGLGPSWNRYGDLTITADPGRAGATIAGRRTVHAAYQIGGGAATHVGSGWSLDAGFYVVHRGDYTNQPLAILTDGTMRTDLQSTGRLATTEVHIGLRRAF
jgi:opacity protein-like surface antigen